MDKILNKLRESYNDMEINSDNRYQIFCDMDGVLTDFSLQFSILAGKNSEHSEGLLPSEYERKYGVVQFWKLISDQGEDFWVNMPWMSDGKQLWNYIQSYDPVILSAPSRDKTSISGKLKWLQNNIKLPNYNVQLKYKNGWDGTSKIILNSKKHLFVRSSKDILIDDTKKKIEAWRDAGGTAIHHISTENTIKQLKELQID
jgi:hypothetical protein